VRRAFWNLAYRMYGRRRLTVLPELVLYSWGLFWALICGLAVIVSPANADVLTIGWLAFGLLLIAAGLAHRRIRKLREAGGESALFFKRAKYNHG